MGRVKDELLFQLIHDFFTSYLQEQRNCSVHTIRSYRNSLNSFLDFVKDKHNILFSSLTFQMLDSRALAEYLGKMEENGCSISTRNNRLNGIRSFFAYASKINHSTLSYYSDISHVPLKKDVKNEIIDFMSEEAMRVLLAQPNLKTKKGMRDSFIMLLMYDTGARIGGIVNISICDLKIDKTPTVVLHEKGAKTHAVPLMRKTVEHLKNYLSIYHPQENYYSKKPLFYTTRKGIEQKMDTSTIRKFIKSYGESAKLSCIGVPSQVHPHMLRHSRAMHLYQHGMDLTLVSQWLGHSKLETTLIYAHADTELKRKAIESSQSIDNPLNEKLNADRYTIDDEEILKKLYGLK